MKKFLQRIFKNFFYKFFLIIYGKIDGFRLAENDERIEIAISKKDENIEYKVYKIRNGRLYTDRIHDTAIIIENKIIDGPSFQLRPYNNAKINENIVFKKGTPRIKKKIKGKVLSLLSGGAANDNYFHWLFDVLPKIGICENVIDLKSIDFFLLPNSKKKFQIESMETLNVPIKKIISSDSYRHIEADELIVTDHTYRIKNKAEEEIQNIPIWISKWLKNNFLINNNLNEKFSKIYIDRSDSKANTKNLRSIVNEEEVKNFLIENGFKLISLSNHSFIEQAEIINNAKIIVGLHGAGFANLCFCKPKTIILELKSETTEKVIENLALSNDLVYDSISCKSEVFDLKNQFGHIKIPIDILKKKLNNY